MYIAAPQLIRAKISLVDKVGNVKRLTDSDILQLKAWFREMVYDNVYEAKVKSFAYNKRTQVVSIRYIPNEGFDVGFRDIDQCLINPDPDGDYPITIRGKKYVVVSELFPHGL